MLILNEEIRNGLSEGKLSSDFISSIIRNAKSLEIVAAVARNAKLLYDSGIKIYDIHDIAVSAFDVKVIEITAKRAKELIDLGLDSLGDLNISLAVKRIAIEARSSGAIDVLADNAKLFLETGVEILELVENFYLCYQARSY